jgi:aspartate-semialdehyde dehydrogenase
MTKTQKAEHKHAPAERIPVAVLGATGSVGQRFIQLLEGHPWFRVHELVASEKNVGRSYQDAATWRLGTPMPDKIGAMTISALGSDLESVVIFSGLDSSVAGEAEDAYADRGHVVVSNAKNHRMDPDVPLLIPEINSDHLDAIPRQRQRRGGKGYIVTNPNCSTIGVAMAMAPIERLHGIERMTVTTMQAISGAGYAGVASYAILDNIVPYIGGEESKVETEPLRILGRWDGEAFNDLTTKISAQCTRVPVIDGHFFSISLSLSNSLNLRNQFSVDSLVEDVCSAINSFRGEPQRLGLPSAPEHPIIIARGDDRPQPRLDRDRGNGMTVTLGRIRACPVLDLKLVGLVHNTIRGAAGAAILNAELLQAKGLIG